VLIAIPDAVGHDCLAVGKGDKEIADQVAIQVAMVELVRVAEQAVIAGGAAPLRPAVQVTARRGVDVAEGERLPSDRREAGRVLDQTLKDSDATLGRLSEEGALVLALADQLDRDFLFLDLVCELDGALEGVGESLVERRLGSVPTQRSQEQEVAAVLHIGCDPREQARDLAGDDLVGDILGSGTPGPPRR